MSGLPSTQLVRGAFVTQDPITMLPTTIPFQYNPSEFSRTLKPSVTGGTTNSRSQAIRYWGPPVETFSLKLQLSAVDGITSGDQTTIANGIRPQLSQLELMIYPSVAQVVAEQALLALGTLEVAAPLAPITLFSWGTGRLVPVSIESMDVSEQAFDANLNPVRATITTSMRTLNYTDVTPLNPVYALYLAYQGSIESAALKA